MNSKLEALQKYMSEGQIKRTSEGKLLQKVVRKRRRTTPKKDMSKGIRVIDENEHTQEKFEERGDEEEGPTIVPLEEISGLMTSTVQDSRDKSYSSSDEELPRRRRRHDSDSENEPPLSRKGAELVADVSRHSTVDEVDSDLEVPRSRNIDAGADGQRGAKDTLRMSSGATAGLHTSESLKRDSNRLKKEQAEKFNSVDPQLLGRGAETVRRDRKHGKAKPVATGVIEGYIPDEEHMEWGRGYVDPATRATEDTEKLQEEQKLSRYADDNLMNSRLMAKNRWGDPMPKKRKRGIKTWRGDYPPNRFSVRPGYRWDGIDRGNGFEKKYFMRRNERHDLARQAHMWSTEDM